MGAINKVSEESHRLSPELAERKEWAERLGYTVWKNYEGKWVVRPPSGVVFIHLQPPGRKPFKPLRVADFDGSHAQLMEFWEGLPSEEKYSSRDPYKGGDLYKVDPELRSQWERFRDAQCSLGSRRRPSLYQAVQGCPLPQALPRPVDARAPAQPYR